MKAREYGGNCQVTYLNSKPYPTPFCSERSGKEGGTGECTEGMSVKGMYAPSCREVGRISGNLILRSD